MTMTTPTLDESIERMKREIIEDIKAGQVPVDCPSFSALHDYVDANCYGGFCEEDVMQSLLDHFGGRDENEGMPDDLMTYLNAAQDAIDRWIKDGGIQKLALPLPILCSKPNAVEIDERSELVSSMSNMAVGKAFNAIIKGIGINDIGEILFNWNESQLNEDDDKIFRYPGRDGRFSRGKEGGKIIVGKREFLAWLLSDDPFNEKVYGGNIRSDTEWTSLIQRARKAALSAR